ncbi:FAD-dependent oxidoreductase [Paracoccaceae bacterium]|nr:FAD-dependent oxidoreductase [Paracoccaceae bacterium]
MFEHLLQPFTIRNLTVKNRIVSTAHAPAYGKDGMPGERYRLYHEQKAKGGIGMSMFGGSSPISADSPASFGQLDLSRDVTIPFLSAFSKRMHAHDCAIICQLTHLGRRTHWDAGDWLPAVAPSPIREAAHGTFPKTIEQTDIDRILEDFGKAALRCKHGGLDGCEVMTGGQLIGQFLSPITNTRTDNYGGSLENRIRFGLQALEAIRKSVGPDFVVGLRFSADDKDEGGIAFPEGIEIAKIFAQSGYIDYLNVVIGNNWANDGVAYTVANMSFPGAPHLNAAAAIKKATDFPVIHASRIADLETANFAIGEGLVDFVGMTRAHLADPYLVEKLRAGQADRIRPCVGANYCIDRIYKSGSAFCIHNVSTGREALVPQKITPASGTPRRVVVVGGGPGGMEAARVCAERGHTVILLEATGELGGQVLTAARAPWRQGLLGITDWLKKELETLPVDIRYNVFAEGSDIEVLNPDVVIVATGGLPNLESVSGSNLAVSTWDILNGHDAPASNVLVYDDHSEHQAASVAEFLLENGSKVVTFAHPERAAFSGLGPTNAAIHYRNLYEAGIEFMPNTRLKTIVRDGNTLSVTFANEYSSVPTTQSFDQVVVEHGTLPMDDIYFNLLDNSANAGVIDIDALTHNKPQPLSGSNGAYVLWRVGDAVVTRNIHAAILDARRLCQNLN